jgi:hypothetical protein
LLKLPAKPPALLCFVKTPGKTSGAAWHSAWNSTDLTPNSRQNIRRRLAFRLEFDRFDPKLPAKHPAPPGIPPDVLSNFEKYGCLSGYSRTFSRHFVFERQNEPPSVLPSVWSKSRRFTLHQAKSRLFCRPHAPNPNP